MNVILILLCLSFITVLHLVDCLGNSNRHQHKRSNHNNAESKIEVRQAHTYSNNQLQEYNNDSHENYGESNNSSLGNTTKGKK